MGIIRQYIKNAPFKKLILFVTIPIILAGMLLSGVISYFLVENRSKEIISQSALNTVSQASEYMSVQLFGVFEAFYAFEKNKLNLDAALDNSKITDENYIDLYNSLIKIYNENENMLDTVFLGFHFSDGTNHYIHYSKDKLEMMSLDFTEQIGNYSLDAAQVRNYVWSLNNANTVFRKQSPSAVSLYKVLEYPAADAKALLYFGFKNAFFREILFDNMKSEDFYTALIDQDGVAFFPAYRNRQIDETESVRLGNLNGDKGVTSLRLDGDSYMFIHDAIAFPRWRFASVIKESTLFSPNDHLLNVYLIVFVAILIPLLFLAWLSANMITKPINKWVKAIKTIQDDQFDISFDDNMCYEITQMNRGLQHMVGKVNRLLANIQEQNEKKRTLELRVLQEQINPHFLYNTLYSIQELNNLGEFDQAARMMTNLSSFFRLSLSKGHEIVPIRNEMELIEEYLAIQQMRYSNLTYKLEMDEKLMNFNIVKLTLQPIIENAIHHGVYGVDNGMIIVRGTLTEDTIEIQIIDNGEGIPAHQLDRINHALATGDWDAMPSSYGIRNVQERLLIYYGRPYGLTYRSEENQGTTVTIRIDRKLGGDVAVAVTE